LSNLVNFSRQTGIFDPEDFSDKRVTIIGMGAIGSFTAITLAKMGIKNLNIYDFDKITPHNIPNQFYKIKQVGMSKVDAICYIIKEFSESDIFFGDKFTKDAKVNGDIVISLVDKMETRKIIFEKTRKLGIPFIDARMGGEYLRVYAVTDKKSENRYKETLYSDEKTEPLRCTERSIIFNPLIASGFISILVKKILKKEKLPFEILGDLKTIEFFKTF